MNGPSRVLKPTHKPAWPKRAKRKRNQGFIVPVVWWVIIAWVAVIMLIVPVVVMVAWYEFSGPITGTPLPMPGQPVPEDAGHIPLRSPVAVEPTRCNCGGNCLDQPIEQ